jgi:hypothetical protein
MKKILLIGLLILPTSAFAGGVPSSFTYQGIVMNSAGTAPLTSVVSLKLSIYDPTAQCLLYQEQQANIDLSQTNGTFAVQVGSGVGSAKRVGGTDQGLAMSSIFANNGQILAASTSNCTAGYTPAANDIRLLRVAVTSGGSTVTISPDLQINSVPNAMVAETLQGLTPVNLLKNLPGSIGSTGSTSAWRFEVANITAASSSSCVINSQSGTWLTVTPSATGDCIIHFTTSFSSPPYCFGTNTNGGGVGFVWSQDFRGTTTSQTEVTNQYISYSNGIGGLAGDPFNIICIGLR